MLGDEEVEIESEEGVEPIIMKDVDVEKIYPKAEQQRVVLRINELLKA